MEPILVPRDLLIGRCGFATIPAFLADIFGADNVGAIHGALLTAWSAAALLAVGFVLTLLVRPLNRDR